MIPQDAKPPAGDGRAGAQQVADRIRILRDELSSELIQSVLALTPEQRQRFDDWSCATLAGLAEQFDVDTSASQKRISWGMRIASTLGGLALCAAIVLFSVRYWGYMNAAGQLAIVTLAPLVLLAATEAVSRHERTPYFTGLLALLALASFVLNLAVLGSIFNVISTEGALLPWGAFAIVLAYRYSLRVLLTLGLFLSMAYCSATLVAQQGYHWLQFLTRPEHFLLLGALVFAMSFWPPHPHSTGFPRVYRLVGAVTVLVAILSLAEWGLPSYLPLKPEDVERVYSIVGLVLSAGAIWAGIRMNWNAIVNTSSVLFAIFLFTRLFHWWWAWMPKYLFFAAIGALGILLLLAFKKLRGSTVRLDLGAAS